MVSIIYTEYAFDEVRFNAFCAKYELIFPTSFVSFLRRNNDGELEPNIIRFPDNDYYIRYFYGTSKDECSDIETVYDWYRTRLPHKCVPIADPDFGNQICISLDAGTYGKIYFWDHETMDTPLDLKCDLRLSDMTLIANSFDELCERIEASPY